MQLSKAEVSCQLKFLSSQFLDVSATCDFTMSAYLIYGSHNPD